ncbi:MAG: hypothetical protein WA621_10030 [Candidatus Acidiferrum sp.]
MSTFAACNLLPGAGDGEGLNPKNEPGDARGVGRGQNSRRGIIRAKIVTGAMAFA